MRDELNPTVTSVIKGEIFKDDVSIPAVLHYRYSEYGHEPVTCSILIDNEGPFPHLALDGSRLGHTILQFRGTDVDGHDIWIPRLRLGGRRGQGIAELFVHSKKRDLLWSNHPVGSYECYLFVPFTDLAILEEDFEHSPEKKVHYWESRPTSISWSTDMGRAELVRLTKGAGTVNIGADIAHVDLDSLAIKLTVESYKYTSIKEMLSDLWESQDFVCWLFSFLSRKRIDWYQGTLSKRFDDGRTMYSDITIRRKIFYTKDDPEYGELLEVLVDRKTLRDGNFAHMLTVYQGLPQHTQDVILQAIQLLQLTHDSISFEMTQSIIYACFEMVINALSDENTNFTLSKDEFDSLQENLKKSIKDAFPGQDNKAIRESLYRKVPELRRRAFHEKVEKVLSDNGIELSDLWHSETQDFRAALEEMNKRRNSLFHQGIITDYALAGQDFYRLRYLISFLILKVLEYPTDLISDVDGINSDRSYAQLKPEQLPR